MNDSPAPIDPQLAKATRELDKLRRQGVSARAELSRVNKKVNDAEQRFGGSNAARLIEANAELVCATLRSQKEAEDATRVLLETVRLAVLDPLTQLPNRDVFEQRFTAAIAAAKRNQTRVAVLFLDLNNFKEINDTMGHGAGDEVLRRAARSLEGVVSESDIVTRHGGDEFVLLLHEVGEVGDAIGVAQKLITALAEPTHVGGRESRLSASIGICLYPEDGKDASALIHCADVAMYRAKRAGPEGSIVHGMTLWRGDGTASRLPELRAPPVQDERHRTDFERRQEQMREANEQLVFAVLEAQTLHSAAELAHRKQKEFLAVAAHELRNPLTPIRIAANLLDGARADELPDLRDTIERQVVYMSRLVGDLLDVSRANTGKLRLQRSEIDLSQVLEDAISTCHPAILERNQRLDVHRPDEILSMYGDAMRLTQVISNLLDNASKYTPEGGHIELSAVHSADRLVVTVGDDGIGIPAEALLVVFDPFVQDARAARFNPDGLGIGLSVVRELVEAHGGKVVASSAGEGLGSLFSVSLPLSGSSGSELPARPAPLPWNPLRRP